MTPRFSTSQFVIAPYAFGGYTSFQHLQVAVVRLGLPPLPLAGRAQSADALRLDRALAWARSAGLDAIPDISKLAADLPPRKRHKRRARVAPNRR